jgi:hypothetical protein
MMSITVIKDLRATFGPARDQDPRPTCMAFAASDAHAAARPGWDPLSVEWAYYHALKRDGGVLHQGVYMATMLATLRADGQPVESCWPYIPSLFPATMIWQPPAAGPIFKRDSAPMPPSVTEIIARLQADAPVLFTMSVSRAFFTPDAEGVISATEPLEPKRVHALVAVGHGQRNKAQLILVRNSWGAHWGLSGYAWVDVAYLEPRLREAATMAGAL